MTRPYTVIKVCNPPWVIASRDMLMHDPIQLLPRIMRLHRESSLRWRCVCFSAWALVLFLARIVAWIWTGQ